MRFTALVAAVIFMLIPICTAAAETTPNPETRDQPLPVSSAADESAESQDAPSVETLGSIPSTTEFDESVLNEDMTVVLLDADTGEILYERDPDRRIYPASTTKIITALICIELNGGTLDGEITLGPEVNAFSRTSSLLGLKEGFTVSIRDLIYGLMLVSGNDAAAALAVHFGGSEENFVALMNQKAQELGMASTYFSNPHGLDQRSIGLEHYSTAADMARLAVAAYQNPVLMEVMGTGTYTITSTELNDNIRVSNELHNGNYLLETPINEPQRTRYAQFRYEPTTGMKTGLLQNVDGHAYYGCLVASASRDGRNLIACLFADTSDYTEDGPALDRWRAAIALFEFGFMGYVEVDITQYLSAFETTTDVSGAARNDPGRGVLEVSASASTESPTVVSLERKDAAALAEGTATLDMVPTLTEDLKAPITQGETVGTLSCQVNGEEILSVPLVAARSIYASGDEEVTSEHYGVPAATGLQWWMWVVIIGGAAAAFVVIYVVLQRRRFSGRHIGKHKRSRLRYPRSWNDDVPLSALRTQNTAERTRRRRRR